MGAWFQISFDSNIYWQYRIGFLGTRYDTNPIILVDIGADITDMDDISDTDTRNCQY